jgi:hypothetical protein
MENDIECALVAFSGEFYIDPVIIWCSKDGFIYQDIVDGCASVNEMFQFDQDMCGILVWEGVFDDGFFVGDWREPTEYEWSCIMNQCNPWIAE